jgi:hypothetical protein
VEQNAQSHLSWAEFTQKLLGLLQYSICIFTLGQV